MPAGLAGASPARWARESAGRPPQARYGSAAQRCGRETPSRWPPGASTRWNSANTTGSSSGGVWTIEYQAMMPPRLPSARSRSVIDPSSKGDPLRAEQARLGQVAVGPHHGRFGGCGEDVGDRGCRPPEQRGPRDGLVVEWAPQDLEQVSSFRCVQIGHVPSVQLGDGQHRYGTLIRGERRLQRILQRGGSAEGSLVPARSSSCRARRHGSAVPAARPTEAGPGALCPSHEVRRSAATARRRAIAAVRRWNCPAVTETRAGGATGSPYVSAGPVEGRAR